MKNLLSWAYKRLTCAVKGHAPYEPCRFFYAPAESVESGYRCPRCGKKKLMLARWDDYAEGDE